MSQVSKADCTLVVRVFVKNKKKPPQAVLSLIEAACPAVMHDYYFEQGWAEKRKKHFLASALLFEKAAKLDKDSAETWHNVGASYLLTNKTEQGEKALYMARDLYENRIRIRPGSAWDWFWKSCVFALLKQKENAFNDLQRAIDLDISYKFKARNEEDYSDFLEDEDFKKIVFG